MVTPGLTKLLARLTILRQLICWNARHLWHLPLEKTLDLGGNYSVDLKRVLTSRGLYPLDTVDSRTALLDTWSDIDGDLADDTTADVYFRTTNQETAATYFLTEDDDYLLFGGEVVIPDNLVAENDDQLITQSGDIIQTNQANASVVQILLAQNDDVLVTQSGR